MITETIYAYSMNGDIHYIGRTHNAERRRSEHKSACNPKNSEQSRLFFHQWCIDNNIKYNDLDYDELCVSEHETENHPSREFEFFFNALKQGHPLKNQKYGDTWSSEKIERLSSWLKAANKTFGDFCNKTELDKWFERMYTLPTQTPRQSWLKQLDNVFSTKHGWRKDSRTGYRTTQMFYDDAGIQIEAYKKGSGKDQTTFCKVNNLQTEVQSGTGSISLTKYLAVRVILQQLGINE